MRTRIIGKEKENLIQPAVCEEQQELMHDSDTWLLLPRCCMSPRVHPPDCQNKQKRNEQQEVIAINTHHQYLITT
jgi:hypothetical protein